MTGYKFPVIASISHGQSEHCEHGPLWGECQTCADEWATRDRLNAWQARVVLKHGHKLPGYDADRFGPGANDGMACKRANGTWEAVTIERWNANDFDLAREQGWRRTDG